MDLAGPMTTSDLSEKPPLRVMREPAFHVHRGRFVAGDGSSVIGRYVLGPKIATGGIASVHLGRLRSSVGFARTVAIKRLLPDFAKDPELARRFVDEARMAARIQQH